MPHPSNFRSGPGRGEAGRGGTGGDVGRLDAETEPVATAGGEVRHDEGINARLTLEDLAAKAPAFRRSWRCGAAGAAGAARGAASMCIGVGQGTASQWEAA